MFGIAWLLRLYLFWVPSTASQHLTLDSPVQGWTRTCWWPPQIGRHPRWRVQAKTGGLVCHSKPVLISQFCNIPVKGWKTMENTGFKPTNHIILQPNLKFWTDADPPSFFQLRRRIAWAGAPTTWERSVVQKKRQLSGRQHRFKSTNQF